MQIANQPDFDIDEMTQVFASDTGLTAKVLRFVNSSHFGLRNRVTDIRHGILLCGAKRIQTIALALSTVKTLPTNGKGFDRLAFWQDALQRAVFSQTLSAKIARGMEGEAFTAALLQNMALPILLSRWETHYLPVYTIAQQSGQALVEVEEEHLSWNHAQAGAWMARNWGFLDVSVCCIGLHHSTIQQLESLNLLQTPVAAVAVSSALPDVEAIETICRDGLQIDPTTCQQCLQTTDATCAELAQLFDVPEPKPLQSP